MIITPSGKRVLDFGQNISGFIGFSFNAEQGQRLLLRMGELLDGSGEFSQDNIQLAMHKDRPLKYTLTLGSNGLVRNLGQFSEGKVTPLQMLEYHCRGGKNEYESAFALYGFRYALVETDMEIAPESFYSVAVCADFEQAGEFECSNPLINKFLHCTLWSLKSNSADVPTDCPTRERSGWTGDSQIFFDTASYLVDYQPFARKHIRDMMDRQAKNGKLHQIVPKGGEDFWMATMNGSVGWADAGVLIPYRMWKKYGDERILRDNYVAMRKYARFMIRRAGRFSVLARPIRLSRKNAPYLVNAGQSYGEWAEPADVRAFSISDFINPHPEESTAYTYFVMSKMAKIAEHLGQTKDAELFSKYAAGCREAYRELIGKDGFSLDTDRQAKLVRPLYMRLLTEDDHKTAQSRLVKALEGYGFRIGTGFLSTPFILDVLAEIDPELAYRLLENEDCPGWLFMPKQGATTVWEAWEGTSTPDKGIGSLNHYSKGAACEWLFRGVCGIRVSGENHFVISPIVGGSLTYAKASYCSVYGTVESTWERTSGKVVYTVSIPCGCTAEIIIGGTSRTVSAGKHSFAE